MSGSLAGAAEPLPGPSWDGNEGHDPRRAQDFQGGLLEEERQAKKDEEIVRQLQGLVLTPKMQGGGNLLIFKEMAGLGQGPAGE